MQDFWADKSKKDGLATRCKKCKHSKLSAYFEKYPEKKKESELKHREKYKEKYLQKSRERYAIKGAESKKKWCEENRERVREINRESYQKHREQRRLDGKLNYEKNSERTKEQAKNWIKANPEKHSLLMSFQNARRKARRLGLLFERVTMNQWLKIIERAENKCIYCEQVTKITIDHFIPFSLGGNHLVKNIVPACLECNSSKHNNEPKEWVINNYGEDKYQQIFFFLQQNE